MKFALILFGLRLLFWYTALRYPVFRARLKEKDMTAQLRTKDGSVGRWFTFRDGRVSSGAGLHKAPDVTLTFKTAEIAVMGPTGAVEILYRREIAESDDPEAAMDARIEEYTERFAHPYVAAARGYIDDVIDPRKTRPRLITALDMLRNKRDENPWKKHGNIPL